MDKVELHKELVKIQRQITGFVEFLDLSDALLADQKIEVWREVSKAQQAITEASIVMLKHSAIL